MKKLFIYGVTALAMLTGCNDLLDKSPLDTFTNTPAYWSNTDNLDNQCNTFYNNFTGFGNGASGGWFYFKTISDDQVDAESHNWTYTNVVASSQTGQPLSQKSDAPTISLPVYSLPLLMKQQRPTMKVLHA